MNYWENSQSSRYTYQSIDTNQLGVGFITACAFDLEKVVKVFRRRDQVCDIL